MRRLHAHAVAWLSRVARDLGDRGTLDDRREAAIITAANARYGRAMYAELLFERADAALYEAKHRGRNGRSAARRIEPVAPRAAAEMEKKKLT